MSLGFHRDSLLNLYEVAAAAAGNQEDSKENLNDGHDEFDDDDEAVMMDHDVEEEDDFVVFRRIEDQPVLAGSGLLVKDAPHRDVNNVAADEKN